jgi:predicted RNase H-like HicB family nuclease
MPAQLKVVYRRSKRGWTARATGLRGCKASGKTIRETREALREALAKCVDNPYGSDFLEDVRLPQGARKHIVRHWAARRKAEAAEARSGEATAAAVQSLLVLKLNIKDAADLLGVSLQRARQLLGK